MQNPLKKPFSAFLSVILLLHITSTFTLAADAVVPAVAAVPAAAAERGRESAELTEILVSARRQKRHNDASHHVLGLQELRSVDGLDLSRVMKLVPGAVLQTNSRGETQVYMRNAGERQVAVFFDGALMNVPWDNRLDLSLIPAAAIGGMETFTGAGSMQFGANIVGGAFNVRSRTLNTDKAVFELEALAGEQQHRQLSLSHLGNAGDVRYLATFAHARHDDLPLPEAAHLPYSQRGNKTRTNTDYENTSLLLRGELALSPQLEVGMTLLALNADKGVAAEGHLDPAEANVRYWRYPDSQKRMLIFNAQADINEQSVLKAAAWLQRFDQQIDSYVSAHYRDLDERQFEENLSFGSRLAWRYQHERHSWLFSFNGLLSEHRQFSRQVAAIQAPVNTATLVFQERLFSFGNEYAFALRDALDVKLGLGIDWKAATKTADKPPIADFLTLNASAGLHYHHDDWSLRATLARKTRLPTMRELFGEALHRFQINPQLEAEKNILAELAFTREGERSRLDLVAFANFSSDTIDQRFVTVNDRQLRQRINLRGSRILGIEFSAELQLSERLHASGYITLMDIERRRDITSDASTLAEKPELIGRLALDYKFAAGWSAALEYEHRGQAYSADESNRFVPLQVSSLLNLRVACTLHKLFPALPDSELFMRLDNLTDTVVETQAGLPDAGRWLHMGLRLAF